MDFIEQSGVKIPNSVIVCGLTNSEKDENVLDFLKRYGSIQNVVSGNDKASEYYQNLIIEFSSGLAIEALEPLLPYKYILEEDPSIVFCVRRLASVYTAKVGEGFTRSYLSELRGLAKRSGEEYEVILKEMMSQISEAIDPVREATSPLFLDTNDKTELPQLQTLLVPPQPTADQGAAAPIPLPSVGKTSSITLSDVNPPEIQKVVVEHIVRKENIGPDLYSSVWLRSFSGRTPRPNNESDYDTWRSQIDLLLSDPSMSHPQITRRLLESLLSPAADVVKGLGPKSSPVLYLQLLDSAFGVVADGEELFAQFMNTLQDPGEKPSTYLQRLQLALNLAVKRGGVAPQDIDKHLLKQFCRGCWDSTLLSSLQLEQKKGSPPSFSDLLLMLRTEEDRQAAKDARMKKHISSTKQRAHIHSQSTCGCAQLQEQPETRLNAVEDLKKQIASLQSQLASVISQKKTRKYDTKGTAEKSNKSKSSSVHTEGFRRQERSRLAGQSPGTVFTVGKMGI
ncbi:zinc finger CCHC domain-containing protein 12-like [Amphiprion ocellaris]|uniref:zinc finger CCHC domain-containing protein 12-like n=1 Tax=Amphiprion ocellaris TaxID=80972 RepID=UPI002410E966|nr:zinc finger CCHC domain-containing protein 12-like [Amphiprion ocellaris]